jgi:hypothetical protein
MKELYVEDLASHNGHESCADSCKITREALTVVYAGWVLSLENHSIRVPTLLTKTEGNTRSVDKARCRWTLRGRRPHTCVETPYAGIGRSPAWPKPDRTLVRVVNPKGARQQ